MRTPPQTTLSELVLITSPEDAGHDDENTEGEENNPEPEPQETSTAADHPATPSNEPANDNGISEPLPATGSE